MQSPGRRRPPLKSIHVPQDADLEAVASRARYIGSPEHKSAPSFAGQPKLRSSASKCPSSLVDPDKLTEWLKRAIKQGNVGSPWEGIFPRYAWFTSDAVSYTHLTLPTI